VGRNTAPAIAVALLALQGNPTVLVTPADHEIAPESLYLQDVQSAERRARQGWIVTFGIQPTHGACGYGYLHLEGDRVLQFIEKPSQEKANDFFQQGGYFWNSGLFCFQRETGLQAFQEHADEVLQACRKAFDALPDPSRAIFPLQQYQAIPSISFDHAIMESSSNVAMVPARFSWRDLGSFSALHETLPRDGKGNASVGQAHLFDTTNTLVISPRRPTIVAGVKDLSIMNLGDLLVITQDRSDDQTRALVAEMEQIQPKWVEESDQGVRPWGQFRVLEARPGYKIKKITVHPGHKLSLQKHFHRSEHWVVVQGTALVTIEDQEKLITVNESTYIPIGARHRLENPGKVDLVIIETQVGGYTEEDDILRFEDDYQRLTTTKD
jgi:mannose-1-phosphate guanylyltransferase